MTVAAASFPLLSSRAQGTAAERFASRIESPLVTAFGFLCFIPYPAISIGNATAIQIGNIMTVFLLVIGGLTLPWRPRLALVFLVIQAPLDLSALKAVMTGSSDIEISLKFVSLWVLTCLSIVVIQLYAPRHGLRLLIGIALATLVHAAVGFWQVFCFSNHEFPLVDLYVNQSFTSVADNASIIAKYVQRPFGLFPEPSAMSSSLAPWILLWLGEICGIIRFRQEPTPGQRVLFSAAAVSGLALIILSQSGHALITLAAVILFGLIWLFKAPATRRTFGTVAVVFGLLLPLFLYWGVTTMSDRVGGEIRTPNGSWDERSTSLIVGLSLWAQGDAATLLFGLGSGLSAIAVQHAAGLTAIWSVSLVYLYETGLIGALAMSWIGGHIMRIWRGTGWNIAFAAIAVVWLFGITFVTSYQQLLPIWITLGWLVVWPEVCVPAAAGSVRSTRALHLDRWHRDGLSPQDREVAQDSAGATDSPAYAPPFNPARG